MKKTILILATIFLVASCTKNDDEPTTPLDQLPAITTTGANTAGCLIDGKVLTPKNGSSSFAGTPFGLKLNYGGNFYPDKNDFWQLSIANNENNDNNFGIVLYIKNLSLGNDIYKIDQSNGELSMSFNINQIIAGIKTNGVNKTYWSSINSGQIIISRSDLAYGVAIFSGTFNCTLHNKDNIAETIQITNGRFDINALTLNK